MLRQIRSAFTSLFGKTTSTGNASAQQVTVIDPGVFSVDGEKAMKVSAVFSAVKIISEGIARLPLEAERYNAAAKCYVPDFSTPLFRALRLRPNNDLTAFELWRAAVQCMLLYGNAYIVPTRNALGDVISLTLLAPGTTTFDVYSRTYNVNDNVNGIFRTFRPEEVVHLRNVGLDGGYTGCSTVAMAGYALGILRLADKNSATTLTTGGRTRGFLSGETQGFGGASEAQLADVAKRVEGDINSGKTVVPVPSSMKYQTFTLSPADAKVLESKQMTIRDIARFFRVHPDLLYEGSNNTYKAAEVPNVMFLTQTLEPLLVQIEQELAVKLLPANMLGKKRLRFDRERLYSTDLLTEASYNEKMLQTGMYTVNELRQKKGLPPVANGDVALVSANLKGLKEIINENSNG
ncbi:MAG: phage portal protein [Bacteroidaceae bacterium]|nr:phage portal protein [Bacteroidaceae bacterium]